MPSNACLLIVGQIRERRRNHFETCFMISFWQPSLCHLRHWPALSLVKHSPLIGQLIYRHIDPIGWVFILALGKVSKSVIQITIGYIIPSKPSRLGTGRDGVPLVSARGNRHPHLSRLFDLSSCSSGRLASARGATITKSIISNFPLYDHVLGE